MTLRSCGSSSIPVLRHDLAAQGREHFVGRSLHRRRASKLRRAQTRAERLVAEGGRSAEPVREVVERTVIRHVPAVSPAVPRPARRLGGRPCTLPEGAEERIEALAAL
ncbi:hypothetical protein QFZ75_000360 [Streptomyces sp. V3I8]|uniref:hypothetical protein n=1 Tax=Streptomyces sp. V3I8 TaxID=3042279 RepID=UPI002786B9A5|nr:hypothetical protein [Streptomyces sp. V3I8]MDQ1033944.1 hypothetical protein [Streptomyces sp. V3I8]